MEDNMKLIEVNGVKLEVDMRYAKKVEQYRVGDKVKVLIKKYSDTSTSHIGVIVGFDNFEQRPTIIVAYIESDYSGTKLNFVHINKDTKDVEIAIKLFNLDASIDTDKYGYKVVCEIRYDGRDYVSEFFSPKFLLVNGLMRFICDNLKLAEKGVS